MKSFTEYLTETTSTTPPPQTGDIEGPMKDWAQDKLASKMQWHLDQIGLLDIYADKERLDFHNQQIGEIRKYMQ